MKLISALFCAAGLWSGVALAEQPVVLKIDMEVVGATIPDNFVGLSFGMKALLPNKEGGHFFSDTNKALITVFQNVGISHLRVGGMEDEG